MSYIDTERQLDDIFTKPLDFSRFADLCVCGGGGGECNTEKNFKFDKKRLRSSQKFDFLNHCFDGRSETADAKISSKRNRFDTHMFDS
jgi:hypothetical protein